MSSSHHHDVAAIIATQPVHSVVFLLATPKDRNDNEQTAGIDIALWNDANDATQIDIEPCALDLLKVWKVSLQGSAARHELKMKPEAQPIQVLSARAANDLP